MRYKKLAAGAILMLVINIYLADLLYDQIQKQCSGVMSVTFLDIGQGDSIFIEAPNGNQVLIDTSPGDIVIRKLSEHLNYFDKTIDFLITTHPDQDHIGGTPALMQKYKIENYGFDFDSDQSALTRKISELVDMNETKKIDLKAGDRIILDEEIYIDILWPTSDIPYKDRNDGSVITKLTYKNTSFMLTGDASIDIEKVLTHSKINGTVENFLDVDVLKLGHHGSKTSTSLEFLKATTPDYTVVSAGEDNKFGHPNEETMKRVDEYFLDHDLKNPDRIQSTISGPVTFLTDGSELWLD